MNFKSIILRVGILLATVLTFSCSNDSVDCCGENEPSSSSNLSSSSDNNTSLKGDTLVLTRNYAIENMTADYFTAFESVYECDFNTGVFELIKDYADYPQNLASAPVEVPYEISGNTLNLWDIQFKGTSSSLIGTWTQEALLDCEGRDRRCNEALYFRKAVTKLVFTQDSLIATEHICVRDRMYGNFINCNTVDISSESDNVILEFAGLWPNALIKLTYNGRTCTSSDTFSNSEKESACQIAYERKQREGGNSRVYYNELVGVFKECIEDENMPEWLREGLLSDF